MADEAQTTVAPEAPAEAPEQQAPAPPEQQAPEAPAAPDGRSPMAKAQEAALAKRQHLIAPAEPEEGEKPAEGEQPEAKVDAQGRTHDPATGKYLPEQGEKSDTPASPEGSQTQAAPTDEPSEQEKPDAAAAHEAPEGYVRIEVPEPFQRNFGSEQIVPEAAADLIRWSFNNPVRNREIEALRNEAAEARAEAAKARAEAEVYRDPAADPLAKPEIRAVYEDLKQVYGEEAAQAFLRGQDGRSEAAQQKAAELGRKEQLRAAGQRFWPEVLPRAARVFQAWTSNDPGYLRYKLDPHARQFAALVDQGRVQPTADAFIDFVKYRYAEDPEVRAWTKRRGEAERAEREKAVATEAQAKAEQAAKEREEARLREAAERRQGRHPMGRIPSAVRTDRQTTAGEPETFDKAGKTPDQIKKAMLERARARAGV